MANNKLEVLVYTPKAKRLKKPVKYIYQRSEVFLSVSDKGFYIETSFAKVSNEPIIGKKKIRDAIKKAELLYMILYRKKLQYDTLMISVGHVLEEVNVSKGGEHPLVYSMADTMISGMAAEWRTCSVVQGVVSTPKSKQGRLYASLFALIIAKSKKLATEKFMYLWMAMNGLYGEIADIVLHTDYDSDLEINKKTLEWLKMEYAQIRFLALLEGWKYNLGDLSIRKNEKQQNKLRLDAENLCSNIDADRIPDFYIASKNKDEQNEQIVKLQNIIKNNSQNDNVDIDAQAFMTLWLPYHIRCKYFHGELPVSLLCFENEQPLPTIRVINYFMEAFLDEELPKWFDESILNNELKPKVRQYAMACKCKDKHLKEFQL